MRGIYIWNSNNHNITDNIITTCGYGLHIIALSIGNQIVGNDFLNSNIGIYINGDTSNNNDIIGNTITGNGKGILLSGTENNYINLNYISDNDYGIHDKASNTEFGPENVIIGNNYGLFFENFAGENISQISAINNDYGMYFVNCNEIIISNNNVSDGLYGIYLLYSNGNSLINNTALNNRYGIFSITSNNNSMKNNNVSFNSYSGITLNNSKMNELENNTMIEDGIFIQGNLIEHWNTHKISTSNLVNNKPVYYWKNHSNDKVPLGAGQIILANCTYIEIENQILNNSTVGGEIGFSSNINVTYTNASSNFYGIFIYYSSFVNFTNNTVNSNFYYGLYVSNSSYGFIQGNYAGDNYAGFYLEYLYRGNITNNSMSNNNIGTYLLFSRENNILNNEAQYGGAGIALRKSKENYIQYNLINNSINGITFFKSLENTVKENKLFNCTGSSIYLLYSERIDMLKNLIFNNSEGIRIEDSWKNEVFSNLISENEYGVILEDSNTTNIICNQISFNIYGIKSIKSYNNNIYHNNILNNTYQFQTDWGSNLWHNFYPSGGNYWSDYSGSDQNSGPDQDQPGSDGIGDTPYWIKNPNKDRYPFMNPYPDTIPPFIILLTPQNNSIILTNTTLEFWIYCDYIDYVNYSVNSEPFNPLVEPYDISTPGWLDGNYTVVLNVVDIFGNSNSSWFFFTIDATKPNIVLNSPINNSYITNDTVLDFSIFDHHLDHVNYSVNSNSNISLSSPFNISTSDWPDGNYTVQINAIDLNDNLNISWFIFFLDSTKPQINLNYPDNNSVTFSGDSFDFSVIDDNILNVNYSINGGINNSFFEPYDITTLGWPDGGYYIQINTVDKAYNINSSSFYFIIDSSPPLIFLNSPENNSIIKSNTSLDFTIDDPNLISVNYSVNGGPETFLFDPYNISTYGWEDGKHSIQVKAVDIAGNLTISIFNFTLDSSNPLV
jgi:parallel beta-helix repeat protein